ncbi:MAG: molybdopterin converting factor subunit 1 [Aquificaceae bacterium]|nr:molybdopterin converting factor subunit 1 [Aquificaceae bacterium]MDW8096813.1 molybdopterin converting factor subunit 1 [Aquificaceae bacterium]
MAMKLLYFAVLREKLRKSEEEVEFQGTVSELRAFLMQKYPELESLFRVVRFAVQEEYVDEEHFLKGQEQVAVIPPVSGG